LLRCAQNAKYAPAWSVKGNLMLRDLDNALESKRWGFILFLIASILPALGVVAHCIVNIANGKALETYDLVIMDHPVLTNLGVSYLEVLIYDVIYLLALAVGLLWRYYHYKDERDFMRKYNIKGETGFTQDFKASGSSRSHGYSNDFSDD